MVDTKIPVTKRYWLLRILLASDIEVGVISAGPDKIFGTADDIKNQ